MEFDRVVVGRLVLSDRIIDTGWLGITAGKIAAVGEGDAPAGSERIETGGKLIFPGIIDGQVHAGSAAGIDVLADATTAAAAGGVTTLVDMPFDDPDPVNSVERMEAKIEVIERRALTDVALYAAPAKGVAGGGVEALAQRGACAFKVSLYEYHPVRFPGFDLGELQELFPVIKDTGLSVAFHNEVQTIIDRNVARVKAERRNGPDTHAQSRPACAESVANAAVFELALDTGVRAHIVHSTIARGFDQVKAYRALGARVSAETCVQYLVFSNDDVLEQGARLKQQPPIRSALEREALWERVANGMVEFVSSDHVAWPLSRKTNDDMFSAGAGVPGLETLLPAFYTGALEHGLDVTAVTRHLSEGPARHFGLYPRKGTLSSGADADFVIFDPAPQVFDERTLASEIKWSPYHGRQMLGHVDSVYLRGELIYAAGRVLAKPGQGGFVRP